MNFKDKTVCFVDNGLFVDFCRKVGKEFGRALYHKPFQSAFVRTNDIAPGKGFDEIEWCEQPLELADEIDLWVFLDLYQSGLQRFLRSHGARVWGQHGGDELELDKWAFHQRIKSLGLPVPTMERIKGIESLRVYLKDHNGTCDVKTSFVRGDFETFKVEEYKLVEQKLDDLEHFLGAKKVDYEFLVEDEIADAVEVGYDGFTIDGQYPKMAMMAYEIKDCGMIGKVFEYANLAEPVKRVNSVMVGDFKEYGYRGFFSSEIRYTRDKKAYFIDPCCRLGSPSNELLQELFANWPQILWDGAEGVCTSPTKKATFGVLAMIYSEWAVNDWLCLRYPREIDEWVKLRFHTKKGGLDYVVPQVIGIPDVGCVVGTGETLAQAIKVCKERAELIKGYQVSVNLQSLEKAAEVIKQGEKFGIQF